MIFSFAGDVAVPWTSDAIAINEGGVDCVDLSPRDQDHDTFIKKALSEAIDGSPYNKWLHRADGIQREFDASWRDAWMHCDHPI